ncbi:nuclear transport factor 2 family protein [Streptomyces sp. MI02-7b]|uniref:nuclear transport factor 2 family protein n=1 Tax=Streptomyces sp. MI02-7b TaxID=462941 RepID=UPI0029A0D786|nr:nuclear transport factor 2 family protein [Streptomyces sp. MI02-7b]MDX3074140.1 nuclear transport factor 2 family protein [Streptomyces sp. MI02-7b]
MTAQTPPTRSPWRSRVAGAAAVAALLAGGGAGAAAWASQPAAAQHHPAPGPSASNAATVQRLADIEDIRQLKARYFRSIDSKQWSQLAALFTPHPTIDVSVKYHSGKELAEKTAALLGDAPTAHQGFLPEITVNGDRATGIWAMEDYVSFPAGSSYKNGFHGYGEYHDTYQRIHGHWYISSTVLSRFRVDTVPNWTPAPEAPKK